MSNKIQIPEGRVLFIGHNLECRHTTYDANSPDWYVKITQTEEFRKALIVIVQGDRKAIPMVIKNQIGPL